MNTTTRIVPRPDQGGYILLFSAIFLFVLVASAAHFFYRSTENTGMTGISRDNSEALLLAESAMEHLRGQLVRNRLNTDNTTRVASCVVNNVSSDICETSAVLQHMDNPASAMFAYMYYISADTALQNTSPQLLQRIADGESAEVTPSQLGSRRIAAASNQLRINDLFNSGAGLQPRLYKLNANSRLIASTASDWNAETSTEKAAAWIEIMVNPNNAQSITLVVQAVAQVGTAKSYLQRVVGSFSPSNTIGTISPLTESSNLDRGA